MWRRSLNSVVLVAATHKGFGKVSDGQALKWWTGQSTNGELRSLEGGYIIGETPQRAEDTKSVEKTL